MFRMGLSAFLILHGVVHLLYFGHSRRFFELAASLQWPAESWALSRLMKEQSLRVAAAGLMLLCTAGFLAAGLARFFSLSWWPGLLLAAALLSSISYLLLWNGKFQRLADQGGLALLLNGMVVGFAFLS